MMEVENKTTCARHPKVETALRCASCGTLICPKCMVQTPVGAKCNACASHQGAPLFQPSAIQMTIAAVVSVAAGAFMGWAVEFAIGFFTLFLAMLYGGFVADMVLRASGRKRGRKMELITATGMAIGVLAGRLIVVGPLLSSLHPPYGVWQVLIDLVQPNPIPLIAIALAISAAVSRIRYL